MADLNPTSGMFLFVILILCSNTAFGRYCMNMQCSVPIGSARISKPFNTKNVHLYVGDEVDIISKSDNGNHLEFEIGDVRDIIPVEYVKKGDELEGTVHVPEREFRDDEDDSEGEDEMEPFDEETHDGILEDPERHEHPETDARKRMKPPARAEEREKPALVPPKKSQSKVKDATANTRKANEELQIEEDAMIQHLKGKTHSNRQGDVAKKDDNKDTNSAGTEAVEPDSLRNEKITDSALKKNGNHDTVEPKVNAGAYSEPSIDDMIIQRSGHGLSSMANEIVKIENFKIMKKRYMKDYLERNYADQKITEEVIKSVDNYVQNDMLEQLKDPESDLLHMILHYDAKDLPGGDSNDGKEDSASTETKPVVEEPKAATEESKIEAKTDYAADLDGKKVDEEKSGDTGIQDASKVESEFDDVTLHPNFDRLKKKYVENYLKTHYSGEETTPGIYEMVDKFIGEDLVQQLKNTESPIRDELLRLGVDVDDTKEKKDEAIVTSQNLEPDPSIETPPKDTKEKVQHASKEDGERKLRIIEDNVVQNKAESQQDVESGHVSSATNSSLPDQSHKNLTGETETKSLPSAQPEPIPPSGGKESPKQAEMKMSDVEVESAKEDHSKNGLSEAEQLSASDHRADEKSLHTADESESQGKSADSVSGDSEKQPDESSAESVDSITANAEGTGKFTIKNLGNVLKNRFKAFASKFATSDQDGGEEKEKDESSHDANPDASLEEESEENEKNSEDSKNEDDILVKSEGDSSEGEKSEAEKLSIADLLKEIERDTAEEEHKTAESVAKDIASPEQAQHQIESESRSPKREDKEGEQQTETVKIETVKKEEERDSYKMKETPQNVQKDLVSMVASVPVSSSLSVDGKPEGSESSAEPLSQELVSTLLNPASGESPDVDENRLMSYSDISSSENSKGSGEENLIEQKGFNENEAPIDTPKEVDLSTNDQNASAKTENSEEDEAAINTPKEVDSSTNDHNANTNMENTEEERPSDRLEILRGDAKNEHDSATAETDPRNEENPADTSEELSSPKEDVSDGEKQPKDEKRSSTESTTESEPLDADVSVSVVPESIPSGSGIEKRSIATESEKERDYSAEDERDALLEKCHYQPSLPECDLLRGAKISRGKSQDTAVPGEESGNEEEEIGKLDRAWRNLMKIMKRIKMMKLGFVKLFHGPLSVMGLEEIFHLIHDQIEHASPEVITITVCCILLIMALMLKSIFSPKSVIFGASAYDVHKMQQSKQKILQENTEDMQKEIEKLREMVLSKDLKVSSGDEAARELEHQLESMQTKFIEQENLHEKYHPKRDSQAIARSRKSKAPSVSSSSSTSSSLLQSLSYTKRNPINLLESIRKEVEEGKTQQKKLQGLIEEKEVEIQEADSMALRHENEIVSQKEISDALNQRLEKVVEELDLKDGVVMELQEKNGALHVELENLEMERRQVEKERKEIADRCNELEDKLKEKEEENEKLQEEIDEKENEVEVLRDCMAQINNGKLDGEAVEGFDTPEEDPDIKEQLKTERLKQIVESTQALANLKKSEKEKEYFQEGYLEELEKREKAEEQINNLKTDIEKLSKDLNTYKTSSTEYQIKMETLQQYFKQQTTDLHRKLSEEEQGRLEYQRKYEALISQSTSAVEETANMKIQNEDLKNEIKEMERSIKDAKIAAEKETHELWIKNRQANRDLEEMKRERDIYRKRLLEAETARKRNSPIPVAGLEKSRDSPANSDDGRPQSPVSQKSSASGLPNFMPPRPPMFGMVPPPPPMFPRGPMPMPMGPMLPRPGPFGSMPPGGPMMGGPQSSMAPAPNSLSGAPMSTAGPQSMPNAPFNSMGQARTLSGPMAGGFQNQQSIQQSSMNSPATMTTLYSSQSQQIPNQQPIDVTSQNQNQRASLTRTESQKSLTSSSGQQGLQQGQTTPSMQRRALPQSSSMQTPMHSTPINSPQQMQISQLPPSHPSLAVNQPNQYGRPQLQRRTNGSNLS